MKNSIYFIKDATPVVIWHGMGDSCCNPMSMGRIKQVIEEATGAYVISLQIGGSVIDDTINGFLKPVNKQVVQLQAHRQPFFAAPRYLNLGS